MSILTTPLVGFDLETTGPDPEDARIVTAAIVFVDRDGELLTRQDWLVNPGVPIPDGATRVHGITTERAQADGMPAAEATDEIITILAMYLAQGWPVVAFNAAYDFTVLDREAHRHGLGELVARTIVDPHVLDKHVDPYRKGKRTLTATAEHYKVTLDDAHEAYADALAAVHVTRAIASRNLPIAGQSLTDLHELQRVWRAQQAASLESYFRRTDPTATVVGAWPVYPRS